MKPYLAVIYDSFVEAIRAKVLWVLLFGWTAILAAIAPFGFIQEKSYRFTASDILSRDSVLEKLQSAANSRGSRAQQAVVKAMKTETQEQLRKEQKQEGRRVGNGRISEMFNQAIDSADLYSEEAFPRADRRSELKDLVAADPKSLSKIELEHRNRRLIELAFPGQIRPVNENRVWLGYAGLKIADALPVSEKQAKSIVESFFLQAIMKIGLGIIAILVAIVVTSPMVPDLFQAGSLHLLLSKPISRSLLYLSKVTGGCIFVAINIAYLLLGLYLVAGIRLGIWNSGILVCIPIFVFIFLIFYSVSALAGLIWKNAIICVVVTCLFWALCFTVGFVQGIMKPIVTLLPEIVTIRPEGDRLIAARQDGAINVWDEKTNQWQAAFDSARGGNLKVIGPFFLKEEGQLYYGRAFQSPFGMENNGIRTSVVDLPELGKDPSKSTLTSELWSDARVDNGPNFPPQTRRAIEFENTFVVLTDLGLFAFDRKAAEAAESTTGLGGFMRDTLSKLAPIKSEAFRRLTPESWMPAAPMDIATTSNNQSILVYTQGKLQKLKANEKQMWELESEKEIFTERDQLALLSANTDHWLLVGNDAIPRIGTTADLESSRELEAIGKVVPRSVVYSKADGSFAILTSKGVVWHVDATGSKATKPALTGQGKATAIAFNEQGKLCVTHTVNALDIWDVSANSATVVARPKLRTVDWIYYWIINPFYTVNPKPAAVDETITYVLQKNDKLGLTFDTSDLSEARPEIDPWQPLWSNGIFIAIVLGLGCFYLHRQDL